MWALHQEEMIIWKNGLSEPCKETCWVQAKLPNTSNACKYLMNDWKRFSVEEFCRYANLFFTKSKMCAKFNSKYICFMQQSSEYMLLIKIFINPAKNVRKFPQNKVLQACAYRVHVVHIYIFKVRMLRLEHRRKMWKRKRISLQNEKTRKIWPAMCAVKALQSEQRARMKNESLQGGEG